MKKFNFLTTWFFANVFFVATGRAEIFFDHEEDPIPFVSVSVVVSKGGWTEKPADHARSALLSRMWEVGTEKLTNQDFLGTLADYGASLSLSLGAQYTFWSLSLPVDIEKDRAPLVKILKENWEKPRLTESELGIAKNLIVSGMKSVLDKDFGLTSTFLRRWTTTHLFKGFPIRSDEVQNTKLDEVKKIHAEILGTQVAWVGMVGPDSAKPFVQKLIQEVFSKQGEIVETELKNPLPAISLKPELGSLVKKPKLFILDRKGLNQATIEVLAVPDFDVVGKQELNYHFGKFLLVESGLGSFFTDEIRVKRGISYGVMTAQSDLYRRKVFSVAFNPVLSKQTLAFETLSAVLDATFEKNNVFENSTDDQWNSSFKSFKYSRLIDRATADGRMGEKMSVVTGELSSSLKDSKSEKWKIDRDGVSNVFSKIWKNGFRAIVVLSDADETRDLAKKYFPGYEIEVIPYKESLKASQ